MSQDKIEKWDEVNGNMGNNGRLEAFLDKRRGQLCDFAAARY